ncbi:sensor histidine kinase KdpD [Synechococcus sp. CBW1006]|uniref:sensor histidine kinase n=1 Tax=Synechococcus sp. CBW1006 TaxID=1353138 RepID=UPI0018CDF7ED|nr:HAMP domain-containing sensor histidine kinase [Synechococcus sp. CBW1006]QPN65572.1 HAMP domain-containing histidine kinase [Synechococcus sp. CBW1006]
MRAQPSLRLWLQSTTLLAVLAGYCLLLALNHTLTSLQRRQSHAQLIEHLSSKLLERVSSTAQLEQLIHSMLELPGLTVRLLPAGGTSSAPLLLHGERQVLLVSRTRIGPIAGDRPLLELRQDVTDSVERERLSQLLLIAAAGLSSLFTGALLRPVLRRGLVEPLAQLSREVAAIPTPPQQAELLDVEAEPQELRPIASSFNALQERLAATWLQQRSFVDGVAHELRTPITLISGHAQSLRRQLAGADPAAAAQPTALNAPESFSTSLEVICTEARRMGLLVSDLLDLARLDAGRLQLQLQPLSVEDMLLEAFGRLEQQAGGRLQLASPEAMTLPQANGDPERLQQCLAALIDNALRYSSGLITLRADYEAGPPRGLLVLHVLDQGPGVTPQEQDTIFERFFRGSASVDTRGSGLGLSVVRLLMEAMGGAVTVRSAPCGGADFRLELPSARSAASRPGPDPQVRTGPSLSMKPTPRTV